MMGVMMAVMMMMMGERVLCVRITHRNCANQPANQFKAINEAGLTIVKDSESW
jgi:hypothetical protein